MLIRIGYADDRKAPGQWRRRLAAAAHIADQEHLPRLPMRRGRVARPLAVCSELDPVPSGDGCRAKAAEQDPLDKLLHFDRVGDPYSKEAGVWGAQSTAPAGNEIDACMNLVNKQSASFE